MAMKYSYKKKNHKGIVAFLCAFTIILGANSCSNSAEETESETIVQSNVLVTYPIKKSISINNEFQGITQFTQHLQIRAQSTGIISKSFISAGQNVQKNAPLFIIKSREAVILNSSAKKNSLLANIADTILSFSSGIICQVVVQQGDFVQEGDQLAVSVASESLRIVVSVPLETSTTGYKGKTCKILLPNGNSLKGTLGESLPIANNLDQTNQILVYPESTQGLLENIHVRVILTDQELSNRMFVPKKSVYSNEELTKYWVMKVVHDSIALEIPVEIGIETDTLIEITNDVLQLTDTIIYKGGYGLSDSAFVNIIQSGSDAKK